MSTLENIPETLDVSGMRCSLRQLKDEITAIAEEISRSDMENAEQISQELLALVQTSSEQEGSLVAKFQLYEEGLDNIASKIALKSQNQSELGEELQVMAKYAGGCKKAFKTWITSSATLFEVLRSSEKTAVALSALGGSDTVVDKIRSSIEQAVEEKNPVVACRALREGLGQTLNETAQQLGERMRTSAGQALHGLSRHLAELGTAIASK